MSISFNINTADEKIYSSEDYYFADVSCGDDDGAKYLSSIDISPDELKEIVMDLCYEKRSDLYKLYTVLKYAVDYEEQFRLLGPMRKDFHQG